MYSETVLAEHLGGLSLTLETESPRASLEGKVSIMSLDASVSKPL